MLNISKQSVSSEIDISKYGAFDILEKRSNSQTIIKVLLALLLLSIAAMFLPWTQNIRSKGYVTTLNPFDKPQNIQALVGGQIEEWLVVEGDLVAAGDTIVRLTEAKPEYLDPELLANTKDQELAKSRSAQSYEMKVQSLTKQSLALKSNLEAKLEQVAIKEKQLELEIQSAQFDLEAANTYAENAQNQLTRMEMMHQQGIKSLTDLETKRLSMREASAKQAEVRNKLIQIENKKEVLLREIDSANADYQAKISKIDSEIQSAESYRFSLLGESTKMKSKYNEIEQRQGAFTIISPVSGRITKILKNGIGEFVKAQENLVTIVPTDYRKAVELYIRPNDMPLIKEGKVVRLQFDGWPAVIFSGWPDNSFGTFGGKVFAIDNTISDNGKYRVLVVEDNSEKVWPQEVRIGSGAQGLLLLNDVKVYYELWRTLNGFPPDYYIPDSDKKIKRKAPIKKFK